jgi:hypothetical protein
MVRGTTHTTSTAASGVDVMGQSADRGGGRSSRSRWSLQRTSVYHRILGVLDDSVNGYERDCQGQHRQSRLETLRNNNNSLKQYRMVGVEDAKSWMERRLANMRSGIPNSAATKLAAGWAQQLTPTLGDLDECIADIEARNLARHYARTHVERLGSVNKIRLDGVFRLLGGQMNSAALTETRIRKTRDIVWICHEFEVQGGALSEVGGNWATFTCSAILASWLRDDILNL